ACRSGRDLLFPRLCSGTLYVRLPASGGPAFVFPLRFSPSLRRLSSRPRPHRGRDAVRDLLPTSFSSSTGPPACVHLSLLRECRAAKDEPPVGDLLSPLHFVTPEPALSLPNVSCRLF